MISTFKALLNTNFDEVGDGVGAGSGLCQGSWGYVRVNICLEYD